MRARRLWTFALVVVALMGALLGRLGQVQIGQHEEYAAAADAVGTRVVAVPALRGRILDRNGVPLVDNVAETVVTVERRALLDAPDGGRALVRRVADALRLPFDQLWARTQPCGTTGAPPSPVCWAGSPWAAVPVATGVDPLRAASLAERTAELPGVTVTTSPVRDYPQRRTAAAAHVLGYLGPPTAEEVDASRGRIGSLDLVGRAGLEAQYDGVLRGTPGSRTVAVDPRGAVTRELRHTDPVPGRDVVTTLDVRVQASAEQALGDAVAAARRVGEAADSGAAVVLDVRDGGVLAAASYPAYDPSVWTGGITQRQLSRLTDPSAGTPLLSRVTASTFPPASTFKVVSLPAAVAAGNRLDGTYDCSSSYTIGNRQFHNYESRAYGRISLHDAIVVSCDTIFYDFAYRSWKAQGGLAATSDARDPFVQMARDFGLGQRTGIDLPGEVPGRIPGREWKRQTWQATRAQTCERGTSGYPDVARTDPARAAYLTELARENCATGFQFRAGDAANFAIGQGDVAVTPLQMAQVYAAIANGGTMWTPHLARELTGPGQPTTAVAPQARGHVPLTAPVLAFLHRSLTDVVGSGTGRGAFTGFPVRQWPVAGKTGTGEVFGKQDTSWFVAFAPADHPRYAVAVVVSQGGTGGGTAAPAVRRIMDTLRTLP